MLWRRGPKPTDIIAQTFTDTCCKLNEFEVLLVKHIVTITYANGPSTDYRREA
jgi:hypothetical protein